MKLEADEKDILDSVERGEWRSARAPKRVLSRYSRCCQGDVQEGSPVEYSDFDQGPGSDPEAGARGGTSLPNSDRELVAQVRVRAAPGGVNELGA